MLLINPQCEVAVKVTNVDRRARIHNPILEKAKVRGGSKADLLSV